MCKMGPVPVSMWVIGIHSEQKRCGEASSHRSLTHNASCPVVYCRVSHLDSGSLTHIVVTSEFLLLETLVLEEFQSGSTIMGSPHPLCLLPPTPFSSSFSEFLLLS